MSTDTHTAVDVTVLVCTYNRSSDLREMLETALAQETDGAFTFEVLVVDNNSSDDTRQTVERFVAQGHQNLRYLFEGRRGKSNALNTGLAAIRGSIYTIADDDFILPADWLLNIVEAFRAHPEVSYVSGKVLPRWQGPVPSWLGAEHWSCLAITDYGDSEFIVDESNRLCLLACSFRRADVDAVGGYHPELGVSKNQIGGIEDLEIFQRLWKSGRRGLYLPRIFFHHKVQPERLTKSYHRRWHTGHGRFYATMRDVEFERSGARLFDVPAHMYRLAGTAALEWLARSARGQFEEAFESETRLRFFLGFLGERRRQHRARGGRGTMVEVASFVRALLSSRFRGRARRNLQEPPG
jgi:glycosyltransferase involved in cell wall biosynthesis